VSGTILSFELGLLWPTFMRYAGSLIGLPFSLEGFAFFIEAIFIGLYLYGWNRLSPLAHWLAALPIAISGAVSAGFVTLVNAWMNMPTGFRLDHGRVVDVRPLAAMFAPPWLVEVVHTTIAAYVVTGFGTAAVCAFALLRTRPEQPRILAGLRIGMLVASIAIVLQWIAGDAIARFDAEHEPTKFAAMEVVRHTQRYAPITIGGVVGKNETHYALEIPGALSFLVAFDPRAEVRGLDRVAPDDMPPVATVHFFFDVMVGCATLMLLIALAWVVFTRRRMPLPRPLLLAIGLCGPLSILALEAGWFVTEFGRQPWVARGLLRTDAAATIAPGIEVQLYVFSIVYVILAIMCAWLLRRIGTREPEAHEAASPAGEAAAYR
jgi:cytochrome d ubiquinol oxidase subunit I